MLEPEFDLVGTAADGRALLLLAEQLRPDVILLDISMPLLNGIDAARQVKQIVPKAKLVFLTMHADVAYLHEALRVGASGYLLKRSAVSELATAIREVLKGRVYVTPLVARNLSGPLAKGELSTQLTPRQREVLQLVAEGKSGKEIATILRISPKTVEFHKWSISHKLGLYSTAELTRYAIAHGIVND